MFEDTELDKSSRNELFITDSDFLVKEQSSQVERSELDAEEGQLDVDCDVGIDVSSSKHVESNQDYRSSFESDRNLPETDFDPKTNFKTSEGWDCLADAPDLYPQQDLRGVDCNGDLTIIPTGGWDSSDCGFDFEATECISSGLETDVTWADTYRIPLHVEVNLFPWILSELDQCIDRFRHDKQWKGCDGVAPRGFTGPFENLNSLVIRFENGEFFEQCGLDLRDSFYGAREFRHITEHRHRPMDFYAMHGALSIPKILGDTTCKERLDHVYEVLTTRFVKSKSASSPDTRSIKDDRVFQEVYQMISQPLDYDYSPLLGLLDYFIDSLRLASFDWACSVHPEHFKPDDHYKAYEPSFWARKYPYNGRGTQCEGAKVAFLDNKPQSGLLKDAFEGLVDIRNYFVHRKPQLEQEDIDSHSKESRFGEMKRSAVKLALLLGDIDLALDFDVAIRTFHLGDDREEEILVDFREDEVEDRVRGLMSGEGAQRISIISGRLFCGKTTYKRQMRRRWVCLDIMMEEDYSLRMDKNGPGMVEDDCSTDEGDDNKLKTPPNPSEDFKVTEVIEWDWSESSIQQTPKFFIDSNGQDDKYNKENYRDDHE